MYLFRFSLYPAQSRQAEGIREPNIKTLQFPTVRFPFQLQNCTSLISPSHEQRNKKNKYVIIRSGNRTHNRRVQSRMLGPLRLDCLSMYISEYICNDIFSLRLIFCYKRRLAVTSFTLLSFVVKWCRKFKIKGFHIYYNTHVVYYSKL